MGEDEGEGTDNGHNMNKKTDRLHVFPATVSEFRADRCSAEQNGATFLLATGSSKTILARSAFKIIFRLISSVSETQ
jgi:hypothetical protein